MFFCEIYFVKNIATRVDSETFIFDVILYVFSYVNASKPGLLKILVIKVTELINFLDRSSDFDRFSWPQLISESFWDP